MEWNFKLLAQHDLGGFGAMGEGMSVQIAKDGRRIIWLAHESAPKNFTAVDVSDPRNPKVVIQTDLPQPYMRSNSLELTGDIMAVAYQCKQDRAEAGRHGTVRRFGAGKAALDLVFRLLPANIRAACISCGSATANTCTWPPAPPTSKPQIRSTISSTAASTCAIHQSRSRSGAGGCRARAQATTSRRRRGTRSTRAIARTTPMSIRNSGDRLYLGYIDGGMFVLDIADKSKPTPICHWTNSPPYTGFMHTVVPLLSRDLLVVTDESTENAGKDWPKLIWILDNRDEAHPISISTCPMPPLDEYSHRGGRFGAHNIHENVPLPTAWRSEEIILGTFFNGGLRAYDITNPYAPHEIGVFVPPAPKGSPAGAVQLNDVFVDERQIVYTVDRFTGGLYILEMDF